MVSTQAPAEAAVADPQQRLALFCAAEALQVAWGDAPGEARDRDVAVFVGATQIDYAALAKAKPSAYAATGVGAIAVVSNRVSYCLDLRGAAVSLDTACSSALVALDAAASRLRRGDETAALVADAAGRTVAHVLAAKGRDDLLARLGAAWRRAASQEREHGIQPLVWVVLTKLENSLARSNRSRFG